MAQIVAGFGVPHTPIFPAFRQARRARLRDRKAVRRAEGRACRHAAGPDRDVRHRSSQHFLSRRPADLRRRHRQELSRRRTTSRATCRITPCSRTPALAAHIRAAAIRAGYDVGMTQNFSVDHSVIVPLHFLTPDMHVPVIPFFISGHLPPLPSAQRCHALGQAVARAIEAWPENAARRRHGLRQLLARSRRTAHGARPLRRRARSGLGGARHQAARAATDRPADRRNRPSIKCSRPAMSAARY